MNLINRLKGNKTLLNGGLFSVFAFFNRGVAFLLLILLANYIAPAEYGRLSLFNTIVQFMGYFVALSTQGYMGVSYFKRGPVLFKKDFSTICFICIIGTLFFCFVVAVTGGWLSKVSDLPVSFLWLAIVISFVEIFQLMWLDYYRIQEKVWKYGIVSCSIAILNLVLSLYLVINLDLNWSGRVYSHVICSVLFGALGIIYFAKQKLYTRDIDWKNIKMIALWGIPLIPHLASVWIKQGGDRFIINHFHSVDSVGLFSFAINLTSIIIIIGSAFNSSNSVSIYKILSEKISAEQKRSQLKRQTRNITFITLLAYGLVVLGGSILIPIILPRYAASIPYFLILSIQGLGQCVYFLFCIYLFYYSKNKQIMYVTFSSAIIHLGLSMLLTRYSLYLTCLIYVFSQALVTILIYILSQRVLKENLVDYNDSENGVSNA